MTNFYLSFFNQTKRLAWFTSDENLFFCRLKRVRRALPLDRRHRGARDSQPSFVTREPARGASRERTAPSFSFIESMPSPFAVGVDIKRQKSLRLRRLQQEARDEDDASDVWEGGSSYAGSPHGSRGRRVSIMDEFGVAAGTCP